MLPSRFADREERLAADGRQSMRHSLPNFTSPSLRALEAIRISLIIAHRFVDLFLRVQDEGAVLDDFLVEGEAGY